MSPATGEYTLNSLAYSRTDVVVRSAVLDQCSGVARVPVDSYCTSKPVPSRSNAEVVP